MPHDPAASRSDSSAAPTAYAKAPGANATLALLLFINLFNYIDRQVLSAVLPLLKRDATMFDPADPWVQTKVGALATAFMLSYMLLAPLFAWAGDYMRRWWLVGIGVVLWSIASGSSGLATGYLLLLLMRAFVGVGEAAYGPIAPAMISDSYPVSVRGKVIAWFYAAIPVGSALGFVIGGQVAEHFGWRHAFLVTFIGLVPGVICFFMREPPRKGTAKTGEHVPYLSVVRELLRIRSFIYLCLGMTCTTFILGGVAVWVPEYIFQREARFAITPEVIAAFDTDERFLTLDRSQRLVPATVTDKLMPAADSREMNYDAFQQTLTDHLTDAEYTLYAEPIRIAATAKDSITLGEIGLTFGVITVISGLAATLLGGVFGDWLRNRGVRGAYFLAAGWPTLLGWPFFVGMLFVPFPFAWGLLFFAVFFLFFNTGPANTVLANVARSPIRATAFAINILVIHALGDAISPPIIGFIADVSNLHTAFLMVSVFTLFGGGLWVLGARYLDADTAKAEAADQQPAVE